MSNHTIENRRKPLKSSKPPHNTGNDIVCYHCAEVGYPKKLCPVWKRVQETFNNRNSGRALLANDDSQALVVAKQTPGNTEDFDKLADSVALLSTMASPAAVLDSACSVGRIWMPGPMDSAGPTWLYHFALASEALSTTWIIYSGASHQMYNGPKSAYLTYRHLPYPIDIKLGGDTCVRATHYGELSIHKHRIEALHTPTFRYLLLSVSDFNDQHYIVTFGNNKYLITDGKRNIVVSGTKNGRLFQVDNDSVALLSSHELAPGAHHGQSSIHVFAPGTPHGQSGAHDLAPATQPGQSSPQKRLSLQDSQLWHRPLAHSIHTAKESLVDGYTYDDRICETCVLAKHERKIIRIPVQRTTTPFELVHSDTCGPFATKSIGGATHFIVFIDDFS